MGGARFKKERTCHAFELARRVCREVAANAGPHGRSVASATTIAAVVKIARADRAHAATLDQFDQDPMLLNTPTGTVDLKTSRIRPHRREDHVTKLTAVGPSSGRPELWLRFLERVTEGDQALQVFLQRLAGYALTGDTSEHALVFFHGTGGNGKGVFLNTMTGIMADYAKVAPIETFTASIGDRHPTDLAMLVGARLVTAQETDEGRQWAESKVKSLTGGDPISARFMRQDFFTYVPQFKLVISGNHKPGLRTVDAAIRRRLHLVPFTASIGEAERDPDLPRKLEEEWPRILGWAIEGCAMWKETGLAPPDSVRRATESYFDEEEPIGQWLREDCIVGASATAIAQSAYASWAAWCRANGEEAGSMKAFARRLAQRGFERQRTSRHRMWRGFELKHPPDREGP